MINAAIMAVIDRRGSQESFKDFYARVWPCDKSNSLLSSPYKREIFRNCKSSKQIFER